MNRVAFSLGQPEGEHDEAGRQPEGDGQAMVRQVFEVQRFTHEDHEQGLTEGWRLYGGWYRRMSGLVWGWFRREVEDGET